MSLRTNPFVFLFRQLWQYSKGNRAAVVVFVAMFIMANIVAMAEPFVVAKILDTIQNFGVSKETLSRVIALSAAMLALQFGFWVFHGPARIMEMKNAFLARANYKAFLLRGTLGLSAGWHADHHSGDTIDKIEKATGALHEFASRTFEIIESIMRLLTAFVVLSIFDIRASAIVIVMIMCIFFLVTFFDKRLIAQYHKLNLAENGISAKVYDVISNVTTVIILRIERLVLKAIEKKMFQPLSLSVTTSKTNEVKWFLVAMCSALMVFLVLCSYFFQQVQIGAVVTIGTVYILYSYVSRVADVFFRFTYQYGDLVRQRTAIANADLLSFEFQQKRRALATVADEKWKELRIEGLSFSYHSEDGADVHLDNVSFCITRGERIALIGESGSGKTTFLKLLRGLYTPRHVQLFRDGGLLKSGLDAMSPFIALIPQDPEIFATTIKENITVGVDHSMATVKKYADMARFTDVVQRLPHRWDSSIVEKGVNLSGGEKQRLALARGLLACQDKSIVLLDEPTSSVDLKNESLIYENIFQAFRDKAVVSSIHRLHLLPMFDTIYLFDKGRLIGQGPFDTLLATSPEFQKMWDKYQSTQTSRVSPSSDSMA